MIDFFFRRRREHDLDEEIRTHLRIAIDERVARGESRAEAGRAARREFGNVGRVKEGHGGRSRDRAEGRVAMSNA